MRRIKKNNYETEEVNIMDLNRELGFSQQEFFTFQEGCHKEGSPDLLGEMPTTIQFNFVRNNYYFGTSS